MDAERGKSLLEDISKEKSGLRQRLLLAAAITTVMERRPVVVGGTAEEYWAGGEYHPTDLDLCPRPSTRDIVALRGLGLRRQGRHWLRDDLPVAVEFPGSGDDIERTVDVRVRGVAVSVISCEDLFLDRIRQATAAWPREDMSFDAALEVALTNYIDIDWRYVQRRVRQVLQTEASLGRAMAAVHRRIRSRARHASIRRGRSVRSSWPSP